MVGKLRDDALSELIGFILIIAILVILMSLYLTYVVPSQGREEEIKHMQDIEGFFTDFKMNLDSLWLNNQVGVSINQLLNLGIGGQTTGGAFSIFPMMKPVSSSGTVRISPDNPIIDLTIDGDTTVNPADVNSVQEQSTLFVNYNTNIEYFTLPPYYPYKLDIWSVQNEPWSATLEVKNITLRPEDLVSVLQWNVNPENQVVSNLRISSIPAVEVTLSVTKNGVKILDNFVVSRHTIRDVNWQKIQRINLLDEAYGLHSSIEYPFGLGFQYYDASGAMITLSSPFDLQLPDNKEIESKISAHIPAGFLNYSAKNPYWINQDYTYKLGEVFLSQEGVMETKIEYPWLKVTNTSGVAGGPSYILDIDLNLIKISGDVNITGPDSIQILSKVASISDAIYGQNESGVIGYYTPAEVNPNAKYFNMVITESTPLEAQFWNRTYFTYLNSIHPYSSTPANKWWDVEIDPSNSKKVNLTIYGISGVTGAATNDLNIRYKQVNIEMSVLAPIYV